MAENFSFLENIDFEIVYNRNEARVVSRMKAFFDQTNACLVRCEEYCQIFACALNLLPPRYALKGTIVLGDPVSDEQIDSAIWEAYMRVTNNPK